MALRKINSAWTFLFKTQSARKFSVTTFTCEEAVKLQSEVPPIWDRAIQDAIKCVGYQSPFLNLHYMTTDENVNWSRNISKLHKSGHPMSDAVKNLLAEGKTNANQIWGIVILLVSKLAGYSTTHLWNENDFDRNTGILKTQRHLAEIIELIASGYEFHRDGILNMRNLNNAGIDLDNDSSLVFGNKMAILAGDMLLGHSYLEQAKLRDYRVTGLFATSARDIADSNFIGDRDIQNNPLPSDPFIKLKEQKKNPKIFEEVSSDQIDNSLPFKVHDIMGPAKNEWKLHCTLGGGSYLGKGCQAALILGRHNEEKQKEIYFMGKHMYLSYRASKDLNIFRSSELPLSGKFSLVSAPLLFHLEEDPALYDEIKKGSEAIENIDFAKVHKIVRNGPGIEKTKELLSENNLKAFTLLDKFPASDAKGSLENLILALEN